MPAQRPDLLAVLSVKQVNDFVDFTLNIKRKDFLPRLEQYAQQLVDHAKAKGVNATWLPVIGGLHTDAWALPEIMKQEFDFFDKYNKKQK